MSSQEPCWKLSMLVSFGRSNNTGAVAVKTDGTNLEEKSYFKKLWLSFSSKLNWIGFSLLLKLPPKKLEPWFVLWIFFSVTAKSVQKILHSWNLAKIFLVYSDALKKRYMKSQQGDALFCTSFKIVAFPKGNETKKEKKITTFSNRHVILELLIQRFQFLNRFNSK